MPRRPLLVFPVWSPRDAARCRVTPLCASVPLHRLPPGLVFPAGFPRLPTLWDFLRGPPVCSHPLALGPHARKHPGPPPCICGCQTLHIWFTFCLSLLVKIPAHGGGGGVSRCAPPRWPACAHTRTHTRTHTQVCVRPDQCRYMCACTRVTFKGLVGNCSFSSYYKNGPVFKLCICCLQTYKYV